MDLDQLSWIRYVQLQGLFRHNKEAWSRSISLPEIVIHSLNTEQYAISASYSTTRLIDSAYWCKNNLSSYLIRQAVIAQAQLSQNSKCALKTTIFLPK